MGVGTRNLNALVTSLVVNHVVAAGRPALVTDGVAIASWKTNGAFSANGAMVLIDGSTAAATLGNPTGGANGAEIWGYIGGAIAEWFRIGYLNDGSPVDLASDTEGYAQELGRVGVFDRLCVAGAPSAGVITARFIPIESYS